MNLQDEPSFGEDAPSARRGGLKALILGAVLAVSPLRPLIVQGRWEGEGVKWPQRAPMTIFQAVTRLTARRLLNLAVAGGATLGWLCLAYPPKRTDDLGHTAFDDVVAGMPAFADYMMAITALSAGVGLASAVYAACYWPRRVQVNRERRYMRWLDYRRVAHDFTLAGFIVMAAAVLLFDRMTGVGR